MSGPTATAPAGPSRASLLLLASGAFISGASLRVADPLLPTLAQTFGSTVREAAIVLTAFMLAYGSFQAVHGPLGDRFGKLRVMAVGMGCASVAAFACAFAHALPMLAVARFATGMCAGAIIPLAMAWIGDHTPYERRQAVLGRFIAGTLLGQSMGPLLGGVISDAIGWRGVFVLLAAMFLTMAVLIGRASRAPDERGSGTYTPPWERYLALLRSARARPVLFTVGLEGMLFFGSFGYAGAYLKQTFGLTDSVTGLLVAGFGVGGLVYSALAPRLVRRFGETGLVAAGGVVLCACFVALALLRSVAAIAVVMLFVGLGFYLLHNTLQTRATEMAPQARGAAVSFFALFLFLGQAVGVALFGHLIEATGYRTGFVVAAVGLLALAFVFRARIARLKAAAAAAPAR
ncbi:MAG: MFS transporter [Burkholderiales bacterium]|nr:MFS transporter [Burkholderiales bacterium]